jgi:hypothetical protein
VSKGFLWLSVVMYAWVAVEQVWKGNYNFGGMYAGYCFAAVFAARMAV